MNRLLEKLHGSPCQIEGRQDKTRQDKTGQAGGRPRDRGFVLGLVHDLLRTSFPVAAALVLIQAHRGLRLRLRLRLRPRLQISPKPSSPTMAGSHILPVTFCGPPWPPCKTLRDPGSRCRSICRSLRRRIPRC